MGNITASANDHDQNGTVEEEGKVTGEQKDHGSPEGEGTATGEQKGNGNAEDEGNGTGSCPETSIGDDQEVDDKESAIYW